MNIINKHKNYDLHPCLEISGYEDQVWSGFEDIVRELKRRLMEAGETAGHTVVCVDCYPGVETTRMMKELEVLVPDRLIDMEEMAKSEEEWNLDFKDYLTQDRVFGLMCHKQLKDFFDPSKLQEVRERLSQETDGLTLIIGVGAGLVCRGDIYVYCPLTRWQIQLRYRAGMSNYHASNGDAPILSKYKRGFFIEWRLADRYKKERYELFDYIIETEQTDVPKMISGEAFRGSLDILASRPFRLEPYFDPGVWGGHWMQTNFGLDSDRDNYAWSFDGVPEENCVNLKFGTVMIKLPAMDLVQYRPEKLLGERVHARFGAEFPIRFDLLDTVGGGNLSLQVHPLTEYIQDTFGMHYTQDESYYLLDVQDSEEAYVYLGVRSGTDKEAMAADLKRAEEGGYEFPVETYVNQVPVKKHDHILIPAGTIHCSGKNTMVLEISATPFIFTFKLWDWGRVGLDGIPRPIHVQHGLNNIQWDRDTEWIYDNIVHQECTLSDEEGVKIERTGLHNREFIDTIRYTLTEPVSVVMHDSVHMMNLVEGRCALIESVSGSFEPFRIHYAETLIVPAAVGEYRIVPEEAQIMMVVAAVR